MENTKRLISAELQLYLIDDDLEFYNLLMSKMGEYVDTIEQNITDTKYISFCCNSEIIKRDNEDFLICSDCRNAIIKLK